jgi:hypothetical protein
VLLETFIGMDELEFQTYKYDKSMKQDLVDFCYACEKAGLTNNSDFQKLKIGKWGEYEQWFVVYHKDKIISMSGAHRFTHMGEHTYNVLYRLATLPEFRNHAHPHITRRFAHDFGFGRMLPFSVEWALSKGAETIVASVNSPDEIKDNTSSGKFYEACRKYLLSDRGPKGWFELLERDYELYGTKQDIWKLNIKNVRTGELIK